MALFPQNVASVIRRIADDAAALSYRRLFELDPSLERMFQGDMMVAQRLSEE